MLLYKYFFPYFHGAGTVALWWAALTQPFLVNAVVSWWVFPAAASTVFSLIIFVFAAGKAAETDKPWSK